MTSHTATILLLEMAAVRFEIRLWSSWSRRPSSLQRYTLTDTIANNEDHL